MLTDEMKLALLDHSPAFVATTCDDGTPNLSPKGTVVAWDEHHLVFLDIRSPQTVRNLRARPACEINVVDPILRRGFRFKGVAEVLAEGPACDEVKTWFERERGIERGRVRAVVRVEIREARRLTSPAYDRGASEREVALQWIERLQLRLDALRSR